MGDNAPDHLSFSTGYYGLTINAANLCSVSYSALDDDLTYLKVMDKSHRNRLKGLETLNLEIKVRVEDKLYRARTARPVNSSAPHLCHGRLWEAGRIAQHYELVGLIFEETDGLEHAKLECSASLFVVAWPEQFAITLSLCPRNDSEWNDIVTVSLMLGDDWSIQQSFAGTWTSAKRKKVTLLCLATSDFNRKRMEDAVEIAVRNETISPIQEFEVKYSAYYSCFVADINKPKRKFRVGYTDIRDCDDFTVQIENSSGIPLYVPVLFFVRPPANITGLVPILCYANGDERTGPKPSAIPVQSSKNWHYKALGNYLRAYALIPIEPGANKLHFQIWYGFYGDLCSASHANLSLVGWPEYSEFTSAGRWEQLAVGCFGETFCLDVEMSATKRTITDVRALMVRNGTNGKKWSWTNSGWGGDWLGVYNKMGRKLFLGGVMVAYLSHGPCLTDVRYSAYYCSGSSSAHVDLSACVQTTRADDYARTFHRLRYDFNSTVSFINKPNSDGSCLFRVGGGVKWEGWSCSQIALGNGIGLLEEIEFPSTLAVKEFAIDRKALDGPSPWWIGFPKSKFRQRDQKGVAWKALIIRSFECVVNGGVVAKMPSISILVQAVYDDKDGYYLDALITPPLGVDVFNSGDYVKLDCEWITIPYSASDYYGSNQSFARHLEDNPASWKTIHREAAGNDLSVSIDGGDITNKYPLVVNVKRGQVSLSISGGIGAVPVRFEGLQSPNYHLRNGTDAGKCHELFDLCYDEVTLTYSLVFNLTLEDCPSSLWTLTEE